MSENFALKNEIINMKHVIEYQKSKKNLLYLKDQMNFRKLKYLSSPEHKKTESETISNYYNSTNFRNYVDTNKDNERT